MRRITVQYEGRPEPGEELDWKVKSEEWNEYEIEDGARLKMKTIVGRVVRLDRRNDEGDPIYVLASSNMVSAQIPPHLTMTSS